MTAAPDQFADFDHMDPALGGRLHEVFDEMRSKCPVAHSSKYGGFWALTSYDGVAEAARDASRFVSGRGVTLPVFESLLPLIPLEMDPPDHLKWRKELHRYFTPSAVTKYDEPIRKIVVGLLEDIAAEGAGDLVAVLATPMPTTVIGMVLGIPEADWTRIRDWTTEMVDATQHDDKERQAACAVAYMAYLTAQIESRKGRTDADDVLTHMVNTTIDGRSPTDEELLGMTVLLVQAGHETTVNGVSNCMLQLARDPKLQQRLIDDPTLIPAMVEESLRHESPMGCLARTVAVDTELGGQPLSAGDRTVMFWGAANRDPAHFEDPHEFRLGRDVMNHLAFGSGNHRCLGEHLARIELIVAVQEALRIIPAFRLADGAVVEQTFGFGRGVVSLPVVWPTEARTA